METKKRQEREVRIGSWLPIEKREGEADDGFWHIRGKAVAMGDKTCLGQDFEGNDVFEVIEKGAFDGADLTDVVLNYNHDNSTSVARTRNGTLSLEVRDDGVYIDARLSKKNPKCAQFYEDVSEGIIDKMSFAFTIDEESFEESQRMFHVRKIKKCYDVSGVTFPAYENTSISAARSDELVSLSEKRAVALKTAKEREDAMGLVESLLK